MGDAVGVRNKSSFVHSGCFRKWTFSCMDDLLKLGATRPLQSADLDELPDHDRVIGLAEKLESEWNAELKRRGQAASLWSALYRTLRSDFWIAGFWCFAESTTRILQPWLLGKLLSSLTKAAQFWPWAPWFFASMLALVAFIQIWVHHLLYFYTMRGGFNARMACSSIVHSKLLRLHSSELEHASTGNIINIVSNDVGKFDAFFPRMHFGWSGPVDFFVISFL